MMREQVPARLGKLQDQQPSEQVASQHTPSTHLPDPHSAIDPHVAPFGFNPDWQVPAASQYCTPPHVVVAMVSCDPAATFTQLPNLPATLQAWHVPRHVLLQQVPSTQKFEPHSVAAAQVPPFGFLFVPQVPEPVQYWLAASHKVVALRSGNPAGMARQVPSKVGWPHE
jgi:hypothetical protein